MKVIQILSFMALPAERKRTRPLKDWYFIAFSEAATGKPLIVLYHDLARRIVPKVHRAAESNME